MNWLKALAFLLVAVALGLFVAALVTPWYRVRHADGSTTHMGLYDAYDDANSTDTETDQTPHDMSQVFAAESHSTYSSPSLARLAQLTSAQAEGQVLISRIPVANSVNVLHSDSDDADPAGSAFYEPAAGDSGSGSGSGSGSASSPHSDPAPARVRRRRPGRSTLDYSSGWVTAIRVLLILTIVVSFLLLCWTLYHAFVHGTSYGWDDGPYMTGTNYLGYMLLFWGFLNGIIILSLASSFGPNNRYDQGFGFNSLAFFLLLLSMCVLCWPVSTPVIVVSDQPGPYGGAYGFGAPYYGGRQWGMGGAPPSTTFGGPVFGKATYASTDTTPPNTTPTTATITAGTGIGTGTATGPDQAGTAERRTQPFTQTVDPGQMPSI